MKLTMFGRRLVVYWSKAEPIATTVNLIHPLPPLTYVPSAPTSESTVLTEERVEDGSA